MKDGLPPNKTPISDKRQKILDKAFVEMRKAEKKMNPKFLAKIRELVKNSPTMIEKLGLKKSEIPQGETNAETTTSPRQQAAPLINAELGTVTTDKNTQTKSKPKPEQKASKTPSHEKIDQSKNIDIISKLMEISPDKKDKIVKMLAKK